jgi:putative flippase GtrA
MIERLSRFAVVGVATNALFYALYLGLTRLLVPPEIAGSLVYLGAVCFSYFLNAGWSFSGRTRARGSSVRYGVAYGLGYLFYIALFTALSRLAGWPHELVQLIAIVCVAAFQFLLLNYWVFRGTAANAG